MNSKFDYTILEAINNAFKTIKASPLILGATESGFGGPPGGYVGYLRQNRVSYDPFELATPFSPLSGLSLVDNLNHIRYRLFVLEVASGGAGIPGGIDKELQYNNLGTFGGILLRYTEDLGGPNFTLKAETFSSNGISPIISAGDGAPSGGNGGYLALYAGDSPIDVGGDVVIRAGNGGSQDGMIILEDPSSSQRAKLNLTVLTGERIFTLPDSTGTILLDAPADGTTYGRKNNTWVSVSGITSSGLDSTYLRLDASNDPVTGTLIVNVPVIGPHIGTPYALRVINSDPSDYGGALLISNQTGNGFGFYSDALNTFVGEMDQVGNSGVAITDPTFEIFRYGDNSSVNFGDAVFLIDDHFTGASDTFTGGTIRHVAKGNILSVAINPYAASNSNLAMFNSINNITQSGRLLSLKNQNVERFYIAGEDIVVKGAATALFNQTAHTDSWVSDGDSALRFTEVYSNDITDSYRDTSVRGGGTQASPTVVLSGMVFHRIGGRGFYDNSNGLSTTQVEIRQIAAFNWSNPSRPTEMEFYVTPSGSTILTLAMKIHEDQTIDIPAGKTYNVNGVPHTHASPPEGISIFLLMGG